MRKRRQKISAAKRFRILARDGFRCQYCGTLPHGPPKRLFYWLEIDYRRVAYEANEFVSREAVAGRGDTP